MMKRKHRVLIVDDDGVVRDNLRALCEAMGFVVETASDVEEAEKLLRDRRYCLVLLDMVLTLNKHKAETWKRAGMEILRGLRKRFDWKRLAVIIITAFGEEYLIVSAFKAGANDFAMKPFESEEQEPLQKKISDALEFGCESRRCCPHVDDDDPGKRIYTARHKLELMGDLNKGRALAIFNTKEVWFQRNTFEGLFRLMIEDREVKDPDGWVHASRVFPGLPNHSHAIKRMLEDIEKVTGVTDLIERRQGRVRLCVPPDNVTWDMKAMLREHKALVEKYCAA